MFLIRDLIQSNRNQKGDKQRQWVTLTLIAEGMDQDPEWGFGEAGTVLHYGITEVKKVLACPILRLHPSIERIERWMDSLDHPLDEEGGEPEGAHDYRCKPLERKGREFLDSVVGDFSDGNWMKKMADTVSDIKKEAPGLSEYLDFLYNRELMQWGGGGNHHEPGSLELVQCWQLAQNPDYEFEPAIVIQSLRDLSVAYEGNGMKFFAGRDYSCSIGVQERFLQVAGQFSLSLVKTEGQRLQGMDEKITDYVRQAMLLFVNGHPSEMDEHMFTVNSVVCDFARLASRQYMLQTGKRSLDERSVTYCLDYVVRSLKKCIGFDSWYPWAFFGKNTESSEKKIKSMLEYVIETELVSQELTLVHQDEVETDSGEIEIIERVETFERIQDRLQEGIRSLRLSYLEIVREARKLDVYPPILQCMNNNEFEWLISDQTLWPSKLVASMVSDSKDLIRYTQILGVANLEARLSAEDQDHKTMYHYFAPLDDILSELIRLDLIGQNDFSKQDNAGMTPVHIAAREGSSEAFKAWISSEHAKEAIWLEDQAGNRVLENILASNMYVENKLEIYQDCCAVDVEDLLWKNQAGEITLYKLMKYPSWRDSILRILKSEAFPWEFQWDYEDKAGNTFLHHLMKLMPQYKDLEHFLKTCKPDFLIKTNQRGENAGHWMVFYVDYEELEFEKEADRVWDNLQILYQASGYNPAFMRQKDSSGNTVLHAALKSFMDLDADGYQTPHLPRWIELFSDQGLFSSSKLRPFLADKNELGETVPLSLFRSYRNVDYNAITSKYLIQLLCEPDHSGENVINVLMQEGRHSVVERWIKAGYLNVSDLEKGQWLDDLIRDSRVNRQNFHIGAVGGLGGLRYRIEKEDLFNSLFNQGLLTSKVFEGAGNVFWGRIDPDIIQKLMLCDQAPASFFDSPSFLAYCLYRGYLWTLCSQLMSMVRRFVLGIIEGFFQITYGVVAIPAKTLFRVAEGVIPGLNTKSVDPAPRHDIGLF